MFDHGADKPPLLVFADDWGRHPSSCQHLVQNLLSSHSVYWVNTIGMRTPRFDRASFRRGVEKLRQWTHAPVPDETLPPNLQVLNPKMWPSLSGPLQRRLNRELLVRQLSKSIESLPVPPVAVTTVPIVADLMGRLPVQRWTYYCVDDFGRWPGLDRATMDSLEQCVIRQADVLIAASECLQQRLAEMGRPVHLLTHGVDLDFWASPGDSTIPHELRGLEQPLVMFWGLIDRRMDASVLKRLAAEMTRGTLVLVGPESDPDPSLYASSRVRHVSAVPMQRLPHLAGAAAVLIMPYADIPVTQAMQPLKLKECLATGKPVVATALPATRPWADCLDLADSPAAFSKAVRRRLDSVLPVDQCRARERLIEEGWAGKARQFAGWIFADGKAVRESHNPQRISHECFAG